MEPDRAFVKTAPQHARSRRRSAMASRGLSNQQPHAVDHSHHRGRWARVRDVIGHEKPSSDKPCARREPAMKEKADDGKNRIDGESGRSISTPSIMGRPLRHSAIAARKRTAACHDPRLISSQACAISVRPAARGDSCPSLSTQSINKAHSQKHQAEEQRLGHRR